VWASDWGVAEVKTPTGTEVCDALFKQPPLEWPRITAFQDRTMVLMCQRLLPEAKRDIYLQGASSFQLPKGHFTVTVCCSPHNPGARELADELNSIWPGLLQVADLQSWSDLASCDHFLVYLNALTWAHAPEALAAEIREALRHGTHLQPCHEFPSVVDAGSARHALEFKQIMDATPADLKKWPTNIYSQIAIALKGGELREPGLANLAARLAVRVESAGSGRRTSKLKRMHSCSVGTSRAARLEVLRKATSALGPLRPVLLGSRLRARLMLQLQQLSSHRSRRCERP
jgi:hypothetical protein